MGINVKASIFLKTQTHHVVLVDPRSSLSTMLNRLSNELILACLAYLKSVDLMMCKMVNKKIYQVIQTHIPRHTIIKPRHLSTITSDERAKVCRLSLLLPWMPCFESKDIQCTFFDQCVRLYTACDIVWLLNQYPKMIEETLKYAASLNKAFIFRSILRQCSHAERNTLYSSLNMYANCGGGFAEHGNLKMVKWIHHRLCKRVNVDEYIGYLIIGPDHRIWKWYLKTIQPEASTLTYSATSLPPIRFLLFLKKHHIPISFGYDAWSHVDNVEILELLLSMGDHLRVILRYFIPSTIEAASWILNKRQEHQNSQFINPHFIHHTFTHAMKTNNMTMMQWCMENQTDERVPTYEHFITALEGSSLKTIQYVHASIDSFDIQYFRRTFHSQCESWFKSSGYTVKLAPEVWKWLCEDLQCAHLQSAYSKIDLSDVELWLRLLYELGVSWSLKGDEYTYALQSHRDDLVTWLVDHGCPLTQHVSNCASTHTNLRMIIHLYRLKCPINAASCFDSSFRTHFYNAAWFYIYDLQHEKSISSKYTKRLEQWHDDLLHVSLDQLTIHSEPIQRLVQHFEKLANKYYC